MSDVFRAPDGVRDRGERWVKTSVSLRADTRMRLKRYAAAHDMKLQDVIDEALDAYLGKGL
ncbi:hypothetical protein [Bifidobacterium animalis]|uniref:hypothetical protein n=1 Tax=Bifidobacterium animalis TaxID=28025 RepID=UPI0015DDEAED|nr:hypothetical protein [Bifidobacterium animalis]QQQ91026.1 hypothetical protein I5Q88_03375 [Bifidobacterium animalis]UQE64145.1 hypothetical protein M2855_04260 [Bifidobacterium animalis]